MTRACDVDDDDDDDAAGTATGADGVDGDAVSGQCGAVQPCSSGDAGRRGGYAAADSDAARCHGSGLLCSHHHRTQLR